MQIELTTDPFELHARAGHCLAREPLRHTAIATMVRTCAAGAMTIEPVFAMVCDGDAVLGVAMNTPGHGAYRIGPVYTPPEFRRRGYAAAATAQVSKVLRDGDSQVCLFADLANPTSNKIYQGIGYRPVADYPRFVFGAAD